jgi:hypothetical protein
MLFSQLERKAMITVCEALQNPHRLQGTCYRVIFGCLSVISHAILVDAWVDYESSQQVSQFLDVLITFAAAWLDRVKLEALRDVMTCDHGSRAGFEQNMHSMADRRLQAEAASHSGRHTIYIILDIALRHDCTVLSIALSTTKSLYNFPRRKEIAKMENKQVVWPQHCRQLLPYGPEDTINQLMFCAEQMPYLRTTVYIFLVRLAQACGQQVTFHLVKNDRFVGIFASHFTECAGQWYNERTATTRSRDAVERGLLESTSDSIMIGIDFVKVLMERATSAERYAFSCTMMRCDVVADVVNLTLGWLVDISQIWNGIRTSDVRKKKVGAAIVTFSEFSSYLLVVCGPDAVDLQVVEELITGGAEEYEDSHEDRWGKAF